jgi:tetratricopeptide (TPR) repeat protein
LMYHNGPALPKPSELSRFWYGKGLSDLSDNLVRAAGLYFRKFVAVFNNYEVRNNKDFFFVRKNLSAVLDFIPLTFGFIFAPAVFGALSMARRRNPAGLWILAYTVIISLSVIMYFVAGRLRLPMLTGFIVLAGLGIDELIAMVKPLGNVSTQTPEAATQGPELARPAVVVRRSTITGYIVAGIIATAFSCWHFPRLDFRTEAQGSRPGRGIYSTSYYPEEWAVTALASLEAGRADAAETYARQAVIEDPGLSYAHLVLGNALYAQGKMNEAARSYRDAHLLDMESARPLANLGAVAAETGQTTAAVVLLNSSLERSAENPAALANLALLHLRAGRKDAAMSFARRVLLRSPGHPVALVVLSITGNEGRLSPALLRLRSDIEKQVASHPVDPGVFVVRGSLEQALGSAVPNGAEGSGTDAAL